MKLTIAIVAALLLIAVAANAMLLPDDMPMSTNIVVREPYDNITMLKVRTDPKWYPDGPQGHAYSVPDGVKTRAVKWEKVPVDHQRTDKYISCVRFC